VEGANAAEVSDLKAELDNQKWRAALQHARAEAFLEVIQTLVSKFGGVK
jgi:hypothetical protein